MTIANKIPVRNNQMSLFSAVALSATSMMGAGWLFSAQLNAKLAGNYAFLAWILAAALVMAVGLCLSQVVSIYPVRGATTRASALSHNSIFGMPFAFANWFGVMAVIATEAQATTQYLTASLGSAIFTDKAGLTFYGKLLAFGILFLYLIINYYGIWLLSKINNVITALKIFTPIFTIVLLLIAKFDVSNFTLPSNNIYSFGSAINAIISAGLIYSYNGFQIAVAFASEVKNPKRNIPLSIILSIIIVMCIYMALQLAFMAAMPNNQLINGWNGLNFHSPLINLTMLLGLNFVTILLIADSSLSPSGTGFAYLGAASRLFYSMAIAKQMPRWCIQKLHPKYFFCRRSLLINWGLASLMLWNSDSWASLMVIVTGYHIIGYMAAPISMGALKPQTRIVGAIVFILLGLIITTIPHHDFYVMNMSLMILMAIYGIMQIIQGISIIALSSMSLPFVVYLWAIYFYQNIYFVTVISLIFYILITHKDYVGYCKLYKNNSDIILNEDKDNCNINLDLISKNNI